MGDKETPERKDDIANDERRQFIARFGKLALVAAPTVAVLVTSMNSGAIAASTCHFPCHIDSHGNCDCS
jgi:hypothetical protein